MVMGKSYNRQHCKIKVELFKRYCVLTKKGQMKVRENYQEIRTGHSKPM